MSNVPCFTSYDSIKCIFNYTLVQSQKYTDNQSLKKYILTLHNTETFKTVVLSPVSRVQLVKSGEKESHCASSFFPPPPLLILVLPPLVLHLKPPWLILLSLPSYLSPACRLSSAPPRPAPSFLLCCPADCATQPTSGWEGWWGH